MQTGTVVMPLGGVGGQATTLNRPPETSIMVPGAVDGGTSMLTPSTDTSCVVGQLQIVGEVRAGIGQPPDFAVRCGDRDGGKLLAADGEVLARSHRRGHWWSEIDMTAASGRYNASASARAERRIPLSKQALAVLRRAATQKVNDVVFSGQKPWSRVVHQGAAKLMLRRMGPDNLTAHGFRSTFRDWAAERTGVVPEVAEAALARTVPNTVEAQ
jgi:hypothetical protein